MTKKELDALPPASIIYQDSDKGRNVCMKLETVWLMVAEDEAYFSRELVQLGEWRLAKPLEEA